MGAILTWVLSLILAEIIGMGLAYLAYKRDVSEAFRGSIADAAIVSTRFLFLIYIARTVNVDLAYAICKPLPGENLLLLFLLIPIVALLDYYVTIYAGKGSYRPQFMDYSYYVEHNMLWAFPLKVAYYFSEIVVMNYIYVLAKRAWGIIKYPITAGLVFLILGWALPHMFTKSRLVAIYTMVLVIIFYVGYEYVGSPIVPIILWFTVLLV